MNAVDLVLEQGALGDLGVFNSGTQFLTQLHGDLGARRYRVAQDDIARVPVAIVISRSGRSR